MYLQIPQKAFRKVKSTFFPTAHETELKRWHHDNGDYTKRLDYPLDTNSNVIDLGGYIGQWASDIYSKFSCNVFVFEAVPEFAEIAINHFKKNSKVKIFKYGIGKSDRNDKMSVNGVGSSTLKHGNKMISVQIKDAANLFHICKIAQCSLLKINIEGGEFEVLPRLIESGLINQIDNLQIQFHNINSESEEKVKKIQNQLSKTHEMSWGYKWVWENWKKK